MRRDAPFRKEAEDDKRAFYPELLPPYVGDARLLRRGDVLEPDRLIRRGYPEFFGSGSPDSKGSGRLELAYWLTTPDTIQSSLVARAAANRVWQHLFGAGLCRTPKELGRLGETPELPALLDGLATRFINANWSSKSLIREIVLSDAYRRSAVATPDALERDPDNRLFTRQSVRRLECEPIMNTMAWLLYGLGSGNPNLPGHVLLTGRAAGDSWAKDDGRVHGGARAIGAGGLPPSLQAQVIRDLAHPIENLISSKTAADQKRWLTELTALNRGLAARFPQVAELNSRTESFETAYRMQTAAPEAFDISKEVENPSIRKRYGLDPQPTRSTGTKMLLARRLVERGVRFVIVPSMRTPSLEGGSVDWDTHTPTTVRGGIPNLAKSCDHPLAGLITDLKDRGLLDQTLVIWGGEMGRGGNGFMNHNGSAFSWWMAGGGVRGGTAYGATDELGFTAVEKPVHVRDLHATILWMSGLDHRQLKHNGVGFDDSCKVATGIFA